MLTDDDDAAEMQQQWTTQKQPRSHTSIGNVSLELELYRQTACLYQYIPDQ